MTSGLCDKSSGSNRLKLEAKLNSRGLYLGQAWWEDHHVWERSAALVFISACEEVSLAAAQQLLSSASAPNPPQNLL